MTSAKTDLTIIIGAGAMGQAVARRLGRKSTLLLVDRDADRLAAEVATIASDGFEVAGRAHDITDPASVSALAEDVAAAGWKSLVHVAGLSPSAGDARTILEVNLRGAALVSEKLRAAAGAGAAAVFISSTAGHQVDMPDSVRALLERPLDDNWTDRVMSALGPNVTAADAYRLSKHGIMAMCRREAKLWGDRGARIMSLSPGPIDTPMGRREGNALPQRAALVEMIPLGREGEMSEVIDLVEFLISDRASFISGTDIAIDGGLTGALASARSAN